MIPLASMDIEATGLDSFHGCKPWLVTACDGKRNYWWKGKVDPQTRNVHWSIDDLIHLHNFIKDCKDMVFHNLNFDKRMLEAIQINLPQPIVHDTLAAAHLVCSSDVHGLKDLSKKYLSYFNDDEKQAKADVEAIINALRINNPDNICFAQVGHPHFPAATKVNWKQDLWLTAESGSNYGSIDAEKTYLLHKTFQSYILQNQLYPIYLERLQLLPILYRMQTVGIHVYRDMLLRLIAEYKRQQAELVELARKAAGHNYSLDLNKEHDLCLLLYTTLKLPIIEYTPTGEPSTAVKTLTKLDDKYNVPAIKYIKNWRKVTKILTDLIAYEKHSNIDSCIHSSLNLTGTKWTRNSSSEPNQQNINKAIDYIFGPEEGYYWLYMDIVNIELRIWAYDVGSNELIRLFEEGKSVHMIIANALYPELIARLGEAAFKETKTYTNCKSGTFARIYGGGRSKVDKTYGVPNASAIIDEKCPEIGAYFKQLDIIRENNIEKFHYPTMFTMTGYKLEVPLTKPHTTPSARIQGTSGHLIQKMMIALSKSPIYKNPLYGPHSPENYRHAVWGPENAPSAEMIQQVHDSLKIKIPCHEHSDTTNKLLVQLVEQVGCEVIPTCPMDYKVINHNTEREPLFCMYTHLPEVFDNYEIEFYAHKKQYLCIATLDKDNILKAYGKTKQEALTNVQNLILETTGVPF